MLLCYLFMRAAKVDFLQAVTVARLFEQNSSRKEETQRNQSSGNRSSAKANLNVSDVNAAPAHL